MTPGSSFSKTRESRSRGVEGREGEKGRGKKRRRRRGKGGEKEEEEEKQYARLYTSPERNFLQLLNASLQVKLRI